MRSNRLGFLTGIAAIAVGCALPAQAAVTLIDANVYTDAGSIIFPIYPGPNYSVNSATTQASLTTASGVIDAPASEVLTDASGNRGYDQEDTLANLTSATEGTIDFSGGGTALDISPTGLVQSSNSGSSFNYDFQLTTNYVLSVNYATAETDAVDPASYIQVINTTGFNPPLVALNPADNSSGGFTYALGPGSYELGITSKLADTSDAVGPGLDVGLHLEQYSFNLVSAAPEPSTWVLLLAGIGGIGLALRQAKRRPCLSSVSPSCTCR